MTSSRGNSSPEWPGRCTYCGDTYAKNGMIRHLRACSDREAALAAADGPEEALYHLRVDDEWAPPFWLDLELRGSASLEALDSYLRSIWLECCGHLSQFTTGGWGSRELSDDRRADEVFGPDTELVHLYDFGTTSETRIRVMDVREGAPTTEHPIALLARNERPDVRCMECDRPAEWLCVECMYETDDSGRLCDEHVETHPHDAYGEPLPFVNSPRTGMCGYTGPAEPPY